MPNAYDWTQLRELEEELIEKKRELAKKRRELSGGEVDDYPLVDWSGEQVMLSDLFDGRDDLLVVHNMGKACSYCTLWADEYNGVVDHLEDRTAFVVVSPDPPEVQREFARSRGWEFEMVSDQAGEFTEAMGYKTGDDWHPGVTGFTRDSDGTLRRVATRDFGPMDDFSGVWHFFDLLAEGADDWNPKYSYDE